MKRGFTKSKIRNLNGEWRKRTPEENRATAKRAGLPHNQAGAVYLESAESYANRTGFSLAEAREGQDLEARMIRNMFGLDVVEAANFPNGPSVYFIGTHDGSLIKIGFSVDVQKRFRALESATGRTLRLLATVRGDRSLERQLHQRFHAHRTHGEWFEPAPELLAHIDELARPA